MPEPKTEALAGPVGPWQGTLPLAASGIAVVSFVAMLALAWISASTLFLVFAGVLLGVFLDGLTRGLGTFLPLPRGLRLTIASLAVAAGTVGLIGFGGATVVQQGRDLGQTIKGQAGTVTQWLSSYGIDLPILDTVGGTADKSKENGGQENGDQDKAGQEKGGQEKGGKDDKPASKKNDEKPGGLAGLASGAIKSPGSLLSDASNVLGPAAAVIIGLFSALGNVLVIVFLGLSFAADPGSYRDGVLRFIPPKKRARWSKVLDGAGETLRHWLFGQLITMAVIFVCTWAGLAFLGIGGSLILGLQAGLLAFVPTVGPLVAGVIILLASLASGVNALLGALGVYLAVQGLESYGLTPFIQKRALDIPPATIFAGQLVLGVIFGLWGIALALPMMAVIKVLLEQLYVEDTLGEDATV